jgi:hypothetical protein
MPSVFKSPHTRLWAVVVLVLILITGRWFQATAKEGELLERRVSIEARFLLTELQHEIGPYSDALVYYRELVSDFTTIVENRSKNTLTRRYISDDAWRALEHANTCIGDPGSPADEAEAKRMIGELRSAVTQFVAELNPRARASNAMRHRLLPHEEAGLIAKIDIHTKYFNEEMDRLEPDSASPSTGSERAVVLEDACLQSRMVAFYTFLCWSEIRKIDSQLTKVAQFRRRLLVASDATMLEASKASAPEMQQRLETYAASMKRRAALIAKLLENDGQSVSLQLEGLLAADVHRADR